MAKSLAKAITPRGAPPPGTAIPHTLLLRKHKRYYRTLLQHGPTTYYVTFKWPRTLPPKPLPKDFTYELLIVSLGDWSEKFPRVVAADVKAIIDEFRSGNRN